MTNANLNISLYFSEGTSNKEYHAQLLAEGDGYVVNFQYGRRGSALKAGTKTAAPLPYDKACAVYDKLVAEKVSKGYSAGEAGAAFQGSVLEATFTGVLPQLLNAVDEATALRLLSDDDYVMQEKYDGHRRLSQRTDESILGINKKGLQVALPLPLADALMLLPAQTIPDGEQIGETLYAFDLLEVAGVSLRDDAYVLRYEKLVALASTLPNVVVAPLYVTTEEKRAAFERIKSAGREGVVFKLKAAPYNPGRPSSGGSQLKYKFTESATLEVASVSATKRSVAVQGYAEDGTPVKLGNVTIPANHAIPAAGTIVEVEYLYAYENGSVYQPVYRGVRTDQALVDCTTRQLKYKPAGDREGDDDN